MNYKKIIERVYEMTKPAIYHSQGYTCAESLIKSYNLSLIHILNSVLRSDYHGKSSK